MLESGLCFKCSPKAQSAQGTYSQLDWTLPEKVRKPQHQIMATGSLTRQHVASHHHDNEMQPWLTSPWTSLIFHPQGSFLKIIYENQQ